MPSSVHASYSLPTVPSPGTYVLLGTDNQYHSAATAAASTPTTPIGGIGIGMEVASARTLVPKPPITPRSIDVGRARAA